MLGGIGGGGEVLTEDEMAGWHHGLDGRVNSRRWWWWWTGSRTRLGNWTELIRVKKCPFISSLLSIFVIEMRFFWIYWYDHVYFLYSFDMMYHINWYSCVESLLQTWNKSHLITVYNPFCKVQDSIANILVRLFASKHEKYQFIVFLCHFIWFLLLR